LDLTSGLLWAGDQRLKDNIHGIVFFYSQRSQKYLAGSTGRRKDTCNDFGWHYCSEILKPLQALNLNFAMPSEFLCHSKDSNFG